MERCFKGGIGIDVGDRCLMEDSHGISGHNSDQRILGDELELQWRVDATALAICNYGLCKSML